MILTPAQLRAARGLLDWTRSDLAKAANISPETVKNIEHGVFRPQESTTQMIIQAFAGHGIEFTEHEGVRRYKELVRTYKGKEEFQKFFDRVYETVKSTNCDIRAYGIEDNLFIENLSSDFNKKHIKRMEALGRMSVKCLVKEGEAELHCKGYNEYRALPKEHFRAVPFYIFHDVFSVIVFEKGNVEVVAIQSQAVADAYRDQFELMWQEAKKI